MYIKIKKLLPRRMALVLLLLILITVSTSLASAAQTQNSIETKPFTVDEGKNEYQTQEPPGPINLIVRLVISVVIIGGIAYGSMRFLKRTLPSQSAGDFISVLDQYSIGMNKGIYVIEVGDKVLALGVTDQNINVLTHIDSKEIIAEMRTKMLERQEVNLAGQGIGQLFGFERLLGKGVGSGEFKEHIQEQIKKLQNLNVRTGQHGKDDDGV